MADGSGWRVRKRVLGRPTRGKTASERLRRLDSFLAAEEEPLLRRSGPAPFVDVGFGEDPRTTIEAATRFRALNPALRVVGVEIDRERVAAARALGVPDIAFLHGGFDVARHVGEPARLIRAMNVLRQYEERDVEPAWAAMGNALQPGGLLVEGTSDPLGRLLVVHRLRREGDALASEGVLFLSRIRELEDVRDFQTVLPKRLIHRVTPGEAVFGFFADWSAAWREASGAPRRFQAAGALLAEHRPDVTAPARWLRRGALVWRLALAVPLAGCAPPDPVSGTEPAIRLLYPTPEAPIAAFADDTGCHTSFLVVVDFLNVTFRPPADDPGDAGRADVGGEAHWHISINGVYFGAPAELWGDVAISSTQDEKSWGDACPGASLELRVNLAQNDHEDLDGADDEPFPDWEQRLTLTLLDP
jgi:hypothetical protein